MSKIKDHRLYGTPEQLKFWADEIEFIGRDYRVDFKRGVLTVFALPLNYKAKKKKKERQARNKKAESAARRV